jgi:hypothetical protein
MVDATWLEFELGSEDSPTSNVQKIFDRLKSLEKPLHEYTTVINLGLVTQHMYFFVNFL